MKRSPLKRVGKRGLAKRQARAELRQRVLARDNYQCQFNVHVALVYGNDYVPFQYPYECRGQLEVHEVIPRSAWPDGELVDDNAVTLCNGHHAYVSDHPADAYALALHGFSWDRP